MRGVTPAEAAPREQAIHLHCGVLDEVDAPAVFAESLAMLSKEERARAAQFRFERHQRPFVYAHALVRMALSQRATDVRPEAWSFVADRYGRPFVTGPEARHGLHFSLSHTEGCVACVVSSHLRVGVDVQAVLRPQRALEAMAGRVLGPGELAAWRDAPAEQQADLFFRYWTLKEAYAKARGLGLRLAFDRVVLRLQTDGAITLASAPDEGDARRWQFATWLPTRRHRLAVADGSGAANGWPIVAMPWPVRGGRVTAVRGCR